MARLRFEVATLCPSLVFTGRKSPGRGLQTAKGYMAGPGAFWAVAAPAAALAAISRRQSSRNAGHRLRRQRREDPEVRIGRQTHRLRRGDEASTLCVIYRETDHGTVRPHQRLVRGSTGLVGHAGTDQDHRNQPRDRVANGRRCRLTRRGRQSIRHRHAPARSRSTRSLV